MDREKGRWQLRMWRDGRIYVMCSRAKKITPSTAYWAPAGDDITNSPYLFETHKQAKFYFCEWLRSHPEYEASEYIIDEYE